MALYTPSEQDLERARLILGQCDEKAVKSKMSAMVGFLKRNGEGEGNIDIEASRGETRREYLLRYMTFQIEAGVAATTHTKTADDTTKKNLTKNWSTEFEMRRDYGDRRVEHWFVHKALRSRPDRYTGSTEPEFLEWQLKEDTFSETQAWSQGTRIEVANNMKEGDLQNVDSLCPLEEIYPSDAGRAGSSSDKVVVKKEPGIDEEPIVDPQVKEPESKPEKKDDPIQVEIAAFMKEPGCKLKELQNASSQTKAMYAKAQHADFGENFMETCKRLSSKLDSKIRLVEKITIGERPNPDLLPRLLAQKRRVVGRVQQVQDSRRDTVQHLRQFGWAQSEEEAQAG